MLKNKGFTYVLLVGVALIWYNVFVRIKSNFENSRDQSIDIKKQIAKINLIKDTFTLNTNYRDPFSSKIGFNNQILEEKELIKNQPKKIKIPKNNLIQWVPIKYYGLIKKTGSANPLALLNIDGEQFSLRKGQEAFDGYKVISITKDSVLITYMNQKKYFYANK